MGKTKVREIKKEIRDNYPKYIELLCERKNIFTSPINLDNMSNNANFKNKEIAVKHSTITDNQSLIVESDLSNDKDFKFKLRTQEYQYPYFRYDSDGSAHRNNIDTIPLSEQQVTTPHFHKFNEDGIAIAYKTEELSMDAKKFEDINSSIIHFFNESNTRLNENEYPIIEQSPDTLKFPAIEYDPLSNIDF